MADLIDLRDYTESGDGFTAVCYTSRDGDRLVKLYADFVPSDVPEKELSKSRIMREMGIRTPEAYRLVTDGKRLGVEFQRIRGKRSFARAISQEPDRLEEYTRRFARLCRELHSVECDTKAFTPISEVYAEEVRKSSNISECQKKQALNLIAGIPEATTCIHGDMHIGNAVISGDKLWWIDVADFHYGNPIFDLGMMAFVNELDTEEVAQKLYHVSLEQIHRIYDIFLNEYSEGKDTETLRDKLDKVLALYEIRLCNRIEMLPIMEKHINKIFPDND